MASSHASSRGQGSPCGIVPRTGMPGKLQSGPALQGGIGELLTRRSLYTLHYIGCGQSRQRTQEVQRGDSPDSPGASRGQGEHGG